MASWQILLQATAALCSVWATAASLQDSCFSDMQQMAMCCEQADRCFPDKQGRTFDECCGSKFQMSLLTFLQQTLRSAESTEELEQVQAVAKAFLIFVNSRDLFAWEISVHTTSRIALARYNELSDENVMSNLDDRSYEAKTLEVARQLNYAAQYCENFFQALWYKHAEDTGRSAAETDFNEVRPMFSTTMSIYTVLQQGLDKLAYLPISGRNSQVPKGVHLNLGHDAPEVVLVVNVVGAWANVGVVTFWSILKHRTTPLRVFVLGDQAGIRDWRRVIKEVRDTLSAVMLRVRFDYIDIFAHPRLTNYFRKLPTGCATSNMSKALFARLVCHEVLPADVSRAIAIDLGDILVFEDIFGLWQQGDLLESDELLAIASHRAAEETWRHAKPSTLNGGVVLYEVARMRKSSYTDDTLRAARHGLERKYSHFCAWDQDIINVMHQDLWGGRRVRVLPCRWSLFPVIGWQFFWNSPSFWPAELFELRRYPGLLSADHIEHFCPDTLLMMHTVFAFDTETSRRFARNVAIVQGTKNEQPNSTIRAPDGSLCSCHERAALLHVPSTMKLWPWSQRLFSHHAPPFLPQAESGAFLRKRTEQSQELGGGFWGAEDKSDLDDMASANLRWAKETGGTLVVKNCVSLPTALGNYARVDFHNWKRDSELAITAETSAKEDAHLFIGKITPLQNQLHAIGVELVVDAFKGEKTVLRWGMQGEELASHTGRILQESAQWNKFWIKINYFGDVRVGRGGSPASEDSLLFHVTLNLEGGDYDLASMGRVYVGSHGDMPSKWTVCYV